MSEPRTIAQALANLSGRPEIAEDVATVKCELVRLAVIDNALGPPSLADDLNRVVDRACRNGEDRSETWNLVVRYAVIALALIETTEDERTDR